jgi:hypothetical protein
MDLQAVRQLKRRVIDEIVALRFDSEDGDISTQSLLSARAGKRIAVGYIQDVDGSYQLELRIQREDAQGQDMAEEAARLAESLGGRAHTEVIPTVRVPPRSAIEAEVRQSPHAAGQLEMGLSIRHREGNAGTLGTFLRRDDGLYLLSCSHVIALAGAADLSGENYIYHPGTGTLRGAQRVAELTDFSEFSDDANEIDAAIARILPEWQSDVSRIPIGRGYENEGTMVVPISDMDSLRRDREICKIGRSTGMTVGKVSAIDMDMVAVQVTSPATRRGTYRFDNLVEIRWDSTPFSVPGDSGSLAFTRDTHEAIGLVFAAGRRQDETLVSYCCDIRTILATFSAEFWMG